MCKVAEVPRRAQIYLFLQFFLPAARGVAVSETAILSWKCSGIPIQLVDGRSLVRKRLKVADQEVDDGHDGNALTTDLSKD